jgi:integrase
MHCKVVPNKRGKLPWAVDYTDNDGKRRLQSFTTKKAADARQRQITQELEMGTHTAKRKSATFGDAMTASLDEWERRQKAGDHMTRGTILQRQGQIERRIRPALGNVLLTELTSTGLQDFINDIRDEGYKVLAGHCAYTIKLVLQYAVERDWLTRSPLTDRRLRLPVAKPNVKLWRG